MTNKEAFVITSIELGWTPAVPEPHSSCTPNCASWNDGVVVLTCDSEQPASLFLTVRPEPRDYEGRIASRMAAVASVLNRDFEPDVSIVVG